MPPNSTKQPEPASRPLHDAILVILISLLTACAAVGGYLIGRHVTQDAFIEKVSMQGSAEGTTLLSAGTAPMNLLQALGKRIDDPVVTRSLASAYGVPPGDRAALIKLLGGVAWISPYRPAPVVGHIARPFFGDDLHINMLGFRDERQSYVTKPDRTVRIFLTGGSTAWGSGASSQKKTISYILEQILNERLSGTTGYRYEVINTAFSAWTTTQEKLLIQQRLVDMHPDAVIMFSGNNDIHWTREGWNIRWYYGPLDRNYTALLNEMYKASGHPEWTFALPYSSRPVECDDLGRMTAQNVEEAAFALDHVQARLIFALQPNVVSTYKRLSRYEQQLPEVPNKPYWDVCYQALRNALGRISMPNFRLLDLSRSFGSLDENTELFVDSYHFADAGNQLIAQALAEQIDWNTVVPRSSVAAERDPLTIVKFDVTEPVTGNLFTARPDEIAAIRIVPSHINKNLLVVLDRVVLPTTVADDSVVASVPASLHAKKGKHSAYIVDGMTGEASPPVAFETR